MRKEEYLQRLERLLCDIPPEDRGEALQFYIDYLEDAGPDAEEAVLRSLGTPEELAEGIKEALYGKNVEGDFTRTYKDVPETYRGSFSTGGIFSQRFGGQTTQGYGNADKDAGTKAQRKGRMSGAQWVILIILLLCAAPVILPICAGVMGVLLGIAGLCLGILLALGIGGIALVVAAVILVVVALVRLIFSPATSAIMLGGALLILGLGLIGIVIAAWLVTKIIPAVFVKIVNSCSKLLRGQK